MKKHILDEVITTLVFSEDSYDSGMHMFRSMKTEMLLPKTLPVSREGEGLYVVRESMLLITREKKKITFHFVRSPEQYADIISDFSRILKNA